MSLMGEFLFFLRLQIKQSDKGIFINKGKYAKVLIKKFRMDKGKAFGTPMSPSTCLESDSIEKVVDKKIYRGMIGSLLYLTVSRPNLMFNVCKCACFQSATKKSHLTAVKRIIRYLIGTSNMGLWYSFSNNSDLINFSDADFAGDKNDKKKYQRNMPTFGKFSHFLA